MSQGSFKYMKRKNILITGILVTLFLLITSSTITACTGFVVRKDGNVLIGHNKDWWSPDTTIHVYPSEEDAYGRLFLEIPFPHIFNSSYMVLAGGFNEHGLCYESFVTPLKFARFEPFKPPLFKNPVDHILQHYTTVQEVIDYIESHNLFFLNYILASGQIFVIDRTGDAAIIEGDDIIRIDGDYHICTNFLQSDPDRGNYPCWRYETLTKELNNLTEPSIPVFENLLETVQLFTQYSWIYDPNDTVLNLYHFHDYEHSIQLDLKEEFSQEAHTYYLPSLFEPENNTAPNKPETPTGPQIGTIRTDYVFETNTTDETNPTDEMYHQWDFGDGTQTYWLYNYESIEWMAQHSWSKTGTYQVKVRARDIYGKESQWSDPIEIEIHRTNQPPLNLIIQMITQS